MSLQEEAINNKIRELEEKIGNAQSLDEI